MSSRNFSRISHIISSRIRVERNLINFETPILWSFRHFRKILLIWRQDTKHEISYLMYTFVNSEPCKICLLCIFASRQAFRLDFFGFDWRLKKLAIVAREFVTFAKVMQKFLITGRQKCAIDPLSGGRFSFTSPIAVKDFRQLTRQKANLHTFYFSAKEVFLRERHYCIQWWRNFNKSGR